MTKEKLKEDLDKANLLHLDYSDGNGTWIDKKEVIDFFYSELQEIRSEDMRGLSNKFEGLGYMTLTLGEVLTIIKQDTPCKHVSD